jgi:hypothetical protein
LAQPPDPTDTFVREVDENLRRDRMRDLAKKNAGWLIAAVLLFLGASGGWIYWQNYQTKQSEAAVEQLAQIYTGISKGQVATAPVRLDALSDHRAKAVRASALFGRAAVAVEQNDLKLATAKYRDIAADDSLPQPFRDLALVRQTALEFDSLNPAQVVDRMAPLAKPGEPWFGTAAELSALALIKQGRKAEAGQMFAAIAKDKNAPDSTRQRAIQMASSLGVDASSALPPAQ